MNRRRLWRGVGALLLAVIPTVLAPWVSAKMEGRALSGAPGILLFWQNAIHHTFDFETWQAALFMLGAAGLLVGLSVYRKSHTKTGLSIVVLDSPLPKWSIGAYGRTPVMFVHFRAQLAHTGAHSLKVVKVYLAGTKCVASFPPIVVAGPYDEPVQVHTGVRPILSNGRQEFTRRAVLVDQFGHKHQTEPIHFQPSPNPIHHPQAAIGCHFCGQPVAMEDLAESAALFAHKKCVR